MVDSRLAKYAHNQSGRLGLSLVPDLSVMADPFTGFIEDYTGGLSPLSYDVQRMARNRRHVNRLTHRQRDRRGRGAVVRWESTRLH